MKLTVPSYYPKFKCKAEKCTDSCCIGWEIPIDSDTLSRYGGVSGRLGEKLRESISCEPEAHFTLCENGRCPFLDERGLCELISELGEGILSDVCREHPRYFTVLNDSAFGGVGMGCEEAARLILEETDGEYCTTELRGRDAEECDGELLSVMLQCREKIGNALSDEKLSLAERLISVKEILDLAQREIDCEDAENPKIPTWVGGFDAFAESSNRIFALY